MNIILMGLPGAGKRYSTQKKSLLHTEFHIFQQEICSVLHMQQRN